MAQPRSRTRKPRERGNITLTAAFGMVSLVGFMALALDVGLLHSRQRDMRTAADAGALAGGAEIQRGNSGLVVASALAATAANGFTHATGGVNVTVNHPPLTGPYNGDARFAEVTIRQPIRMAFMGVFGMTSVQVPARSVAGLGAKSQDCAYTLDSIVGQALLVATGSTLTLNCGIQVNSSASVNALIALPGSTLTATEISVTGGISISGSVNPTPIQNVPPVPDPLAYLTPPAVGGCGPDDGVVTSSRTLNPGVYCSGITVTGGTATLNPGNYIVIGRLMVSGPGSTISGSEVMFFNVNDPSYEPITILGASTVDLSAPTTGPYTGVLFFQDPSLPSGGAANVFQATAMDLTGVLYFPTSPVLIGSIGATTTINGGVVASSIATAVSATVNLNVWLGPSATSPLKRLTLVE